MKKISIVVIALVAMVSVAGVAAAKATKTVSVDSEVTLKFKGSGDDPYYEEGGLFSGKVSAKKDCQEDRKVKVFAKKGGKVGKDETDKQGRYSIKADNVGPGKYFAEVKKRTYKKRTYKKGNKKFVCEAATSDTVKVS